MNGSDQPAITSENLTRDFGRFRAVDSVNLRVDRGTIYGLLGANGAGKSTTIRMLCGLLKPTAGEAHVAGCSITGDPEGVKRSIGYMSQKFSLYEDLTVDENIEFFGGVYGLDKKTLKERRDWVIDMAGLSGREKSLTAELSGGWKQRLALGCAILHSPGIVFLDEPTGGVDPVSRRRFWDLINRLVRNGTTVLVTTHYLDEAEYCDTITLMHAGRIIAEGSPARLKEEHIKTATLEVECDNVIEAMECLQNDDRIDETTVFGTYLHVNSSHDQPESLVRSLLEGKGIQVHRIDTIVPSLEDVFIHLIEKQIREPRGRG
ncbi:MAG: ABC transporter ATP-binding protein [Spirochaetales bacterium]|nr:ABC transporter ATP-binding protein [Spirochaetales bacterium]